MTIRSISDRARQEAETRYPKRTRTHAWACSLFMEGAEWADAQYAELVTAVGLMLDAQAALFAYEGADQDEADGIWNAVVTAYNKQNDPHSGGR